MLNPPAQVQKQWDSLNLSQIILTPTRYDTKNPEKATLLVILTNNPDRTFWKTVKEMENKPPSSHLPNSLVIEDTVVTGNDRITELFNQHFVKCGNLFDSIAPPKPPTNTPPPSPSSAAPCHSFCLQEVSENDVLEVLSKLDPNKPAGLDGLDPFFFKVAAPIIAEAISHLCNLSILTAVLPSAWKAASVRPLFKGGNQADPNCYRPISILPCIAKVLENYFKLLIQIDVYGMGVSVPTILYLA
ncbi:putative 115 kDa protein in type-1 retrotransposable element R1DM [Dissostichus eleginoides]|uniref:115 kDa protein in type-1 retrotransposable element R1DM n=1 Tax=Dissostichus eleginoides TaxID=100907 RepID=A0AAD9C6J0_DISEL|nr:putative 115 kDa protein in type-1 retrotransposable element R1DM [Dissostichus eleginoides]